MFNNDFTIINKYDNLIVTVNPDKTVFAIPDVDNEYEVMTNSYDNLIVTVKPDKTAFAIPDFGNVYEVMTNSDMLALVCNIKTICKVTTDKRVYILKAQPASVLTNWLEITEIATELYQLIADFESNKVDIIDDTTTTNITHILTDNTDKTYSAANISRVSVNIPAAMYHGFYAGLNFKVSSVTPQVTFTNPSSIPLKLMRFGINIASYTPSTNCTVVIAFFCDGINLYGYINEV